MLHRFSLVVEGTSGTDVHDITREVAEQVAVSGIGDGAVLLFTPGSTAALTTIEYEPGVVQDLKDALERIAPRNIPYAHDKAWGDGNGYSHVRAALVRPDFTVPFENGQLALGTWQQIVVLDFDNSARRRVVNGYVHAW
jgi:secondary thiamine-phosphate synthase enzyme